MAVKINVPAGVTDWFTYLNSTWLGNFLYDGHGAFSSAGADDYNFGQWVAGNSGTSQSAALLEGDFSYVQPGGFVGDIDSLSFGSNLTGNATSGYSLGTTNPVLTLDLSGATTTTLFTYVIYNLSNNQSLSSLWSYLGEQGTEQVGNSSANVLYSFAGDDVLTGGSGVDTFYYLASLNAGGWGNDEITDFADGSEYIVFSGYGWSSFADFQTAGGSITGNTISYAGNTIDVTFDGGTGSLTSADLLFIA